MDEEIDLLIVLLFEKILADCKYKIEGIKLVKNKIIYLANQDQNKPKGPYPLAREEMLQHLSDVESCSIAYEYEKFSYNVANNFDRCIEMHREKMICDEFSDILDRGISGVERLLDLIYEQING